MTLIAYHNDPSIKTAILKQLKAHAKADEIIKGVYWEGGKGCAVGCTIHSDDHTEYETRFGIPQMLAKLEDCIFEGLPNRKAKAWPIRFMSAIKPGQDLSLVGWKFLHWLLTDKKVNPGIDHPLVRDAIKQCADVLVPLTKGETISQSAARSAENAAWSAANAAWGVARSAASAAAASVARSVARSAASTAAASTASAVWSAANAAASAANAAAASVARSAAYVRMSDRLIELIEDATP